MTEWKDPPIIASGEQDVIVMRQNADGDVHVHDDTVGTLTAKSSVSRQQLLCIPLHRDGANGIRHGVGDGQGGIEYVVRRLTPTECERLQGFPDGWTDITGCDPDELLPRMPQGGDPKVAQKVGKWCAETPDTPRYKAMGNSMAVPVMRWIGSRIQMVDEMEGED